MEFDPSWLKNETKVKPEPTPEVLYADRRRRYREAVEKESGGVVSDLSFLAKPCPECGHPVMTMEFATGPELWELPGEDPALPPNGNYRHTEARCAAWKSKGEA